MHSADSTAVSNMLLLLLFTACFSSCVAQTERNPETEPTVPTIPSFNSSTKDAQNSLAILQTLVKSTQELDAASLDPVLAWISQIIRESQPDAIFELTVKSITMVNIT